MSATTASPDDLPEFDLTDLENYLASHPPTPPPTSAPPEQPERAHAGRTRRVRRLTGDVAEAEHLVALQNSPVLIAAYSPRVLRTIRRGAEAVKLVQLRQNPAFAALANVRARRFVTTCGLTALVIALGWSTAGVQDFAANGAPAFSAVWWFAWAVEPFVSLALLTVVIARAFLASRGQLMASPTARRVEWLFLGMTLLMNTWRHLPWVAHPFQFGQLVIHALGPIVAVCVVTVLPVLWAAIDQAPISTADPAQSLRSDEADAQPGTQPQRGGVFAEKLAAARVLIRAGKLEPKPSAYRIWKSLGGGMDIARDVRDVLQKE